MAHGWIKYGEPLVDPKKCMKCKYGHVDGACGYLDATGHSRTGLHPEGLTSDCKEFKAKKRARK